MDAELKEAVKLLKNIVKTSTSSDEFKHLDLTLAPASEREQYFEALQLVKKAIKENEISEDEFERYVGIKG